MSKDKTKRRQQTTFLLAMALAPSFTSQWLAFFEVSSVIHSPFVLPPLAPFHRPYFLSLSVFCDIPCLWVLSCISNCSCTQPLQRWPRMLSVPRSLPAPCSSNPPFRGAPGLSNLMPYQPFPPTCDLNFSSFHEPPWELPSHLSIGLISGHPSASGWASLTFAQPSPSCKNFLRNNTQPVCFQWLVSVCFLCRVPTGVLVHSVLCRRSEQKRWRGRETSSTLRDPRSGAALPRGHVFL